MSESIFAALLAGRPEAWRLLPGRFAEPDAWRAAAVAAATRTVAGPLLEALSRQARALAPSDARARNLEKLTHAGTTVVVTGQQVGLFGGPLYTLHKAATAIARARMVEQLTGRPCVPLFWLQTEDHDYAEIAQVTIAAPSGRVAFALAKEATPSRIAIAHRTLPEETASLLDQAEAELAPLPHAAEVIALLRSHYAPGRSIAGAFAGLLGELWKDEGLLILDPRVPELARLAAPLLGRALDEHAGIAEDLAARAVAIAEAGCAEQVRARPEAALVFFHPEGVAGPRYRLVRRDDGWETPAGAVSHTALHALLEREPLRFSTSALLRPLVQDMLLPTCAYVGGPAEVSYFAQLPPLYARLAVPMPLIAPRARLRILDATTRSLLERVGLRAADFDQARTALLERVAARPDGAPTAAELRARMLDPLERQLDLLAAHELEPLERAIRKTRDACARAIGKLSEQAERALLERDRVATERVDRLIVALRPHGVPQERAYGFLAHAARSGAAQLVHALLEAAAPLDPGVRDVCL